MAVHFDMELDYHASPEAIVEAIADLEGWKAWMPGLIGVERLDASADFDTGASWRETRKLFGKEASEHFELVAFEPPRRWEIVVDGSKGASKRGLYRFVYQLEPRGDHTRMSIDASIEEIGPIMSMLGRMFVGGMKKSMLKDLEALRDHLEAS